MMRMIHCSDIHLGSAMDSHFPKDKATERKAELRASFIRMIEYAKQENINVILLAGDVFDDDLPQRKDKDFFYDVVRGNQEIDFLYLRGNHDRHDTYRMADIPNLKIFSDQWTYYHYDQITIAGIEMNAGNALSLYSSLKLEKDRKNIVMLHGAVGTNSAVDEVNLSELRNRNIDYLALGHFHTYENAHLDRRGVYCYSGCLEGRGFDERGDKGFVLLEIEENQPVSSRFVPFSRRRIVEKSVCLTGSNNFQEAWGKIKTSLDFNKEDVLRVVLTGEISYDHDFLASEIQKYLESACYYVTVKDKTVRLYDTVEYQDSLSLRGEFIKSVLLSLDYTEEEKQKIISLGLRVLDGKEID